MLCWLKSRRKLTPWQVQLFPCGVADAGAALPKKCRMLAVWSLTTASGAKLRHHIQKHIKVPTRLPGCERVSRKQNRAIEAYKSPHQHSSTISAGGGCADLVVHSMYTSPLSILMQRRGMRRRSCLTTAEQS